MGVENLARVIGPNIMPLQETSMSAMQNRLQMHLTIVKVIQILKNITNRTKKRAIIIYNNFVTDSD